MCSDFYLSALALLSSAPPSGPFIWLRTEYSVPVQHRVPYGDIHHQHHVAQAETRSVPYRKTVGGGRVLRTFADSQPNECAVEALNNRSAEARKHKKAQLAARHANAHAKDKKQGKAKTTYK
jgi:hypothetical protein